MAVAPVWPLRRSQIAPRTLRMLAALAVLGVALLGAVAVLPGPMRADRSRAIIPLFTKTEAAGNPTDLVLLVDEKKVVGWVSGARDRRGQSATVTMNGKTETLPLDARSSFQWSYAVNEATPARFQFGDATETLTLQPGGKAHPPSVFFVADRSVYRPEQKLQFAGFLRERDAAGRFTPLS